MKSSGVALDEETSLIQRPASHAAPLALDACPLARMANGRLWGGLALVTMCVLALMPALLSPFFADDYFHIEHAARLRDALTRGWVLPIDSAGAWWTPPGLSVEYFRPLIVLSFALDRLVYGDRAVGYHVTNLALHVATTLLLWGIARRVMGRGVSAWAAAALFAVHPAHTVAVGWISGRTDVLAGMLYAAAFLLYLESRSARSGRASLLALSCLVFGAALFAKEMAITFPAALVGHGLLFRNREPIGKLLLAPLFAGIVGLAYLMLRVVALGQFHTPPTPFAFHAGDAGLVSHVLIAPLLYLADLVMFVPADPMATLPFWNGHPILLAAFLLFILTTFAGTLKKAGNRRLAAWGLGWMALTFLPVLMLTVGEHFLYLPSMGYCVLVASQLPVSAAAIDSKARRALVLVGGLVTAVCFGRAAMFAVFSRSAARAIDEAAAALDRAPLARRVLVADLPASAALAFPHAVRLARPKREVEVEILSLIPSVMPDAEDLSNLALFAPGRIELRRPKGYLTSYLERALQGPPARFHVGQTVERDGYIVTISEIDAASSRPLTLTIQVSNPAETLVLNGRNGSLQVVDLF